MRPVTPDEHWTLHSGDARQVRAMLLQYLRESKATVDKRLGSTSDVNEMMRLQGEVRVLDLIIQALEKDPRRTTQLSKALGGLRIDA